MADSKTPAVAPAATPMTVEQQLAAALAALAQSQTQIAALMERQADFNEKNAIRRRKTMDEYLKEKPRKRLLHEVYQNGHLVNPSGLSQKTILKLDGLANGTYGDGLVRVIRITDGPRGLNTRIHLFYSNKTLEQRMAFYMKFPSFTKIVETVWEEMAANGVGPVEDMVADPPAENFEVVPATDVKPKQ